MWAASWFQSSMVFAQLLSHGYKSLLALGSLQFINMLSIARKEFRSYFVQNLLYLVSMGIGISALLLTGNLGFIEVINLQLLAVLPTAVYYLMRQGVSWVLPSKKHIKSLLSFGKYAAGTNLLSMLFSQGRHIDAGLF